MERDGGESNKEEKGPPGSGESTLPACPLTLALNRPRGAGEVQVFKENSVSCATRREKGGY